MRTTPRFGLSQLRDESSLMSFCAKGGRGRGSWEAEELRAPMWVNDNQVNIQVRSLGNGRGPVWKKIWESLEYRCCFLKKKKWIRSPRGRI